MFDLSRSQEIVWLHEQMLPGSQAYNFTATVDLRGKLVTSALLTACGQLLRRHPGLRLELVDHDGGLPRQRINDDCVPQVREIDLSREDDPVAAFARLLRAEATAPLDTYAAPLVRWCLVTLAEDHHRLIHIEHHLVHDGHTFAIELRDLFEFYRAAVSGETAVLPDTRGYDDHLRAAAWRGGDQASLDYWTTELGDATMELSFPGLVRPGTQRRHHGGQLRSLVTPGLAARLRAHCRNAGHTPFSTLLTLFGELLRRYSGQADLVIGTAVGNRRPGWENTAGMFVNAIPLRVRLDPLASSTDMVDDATDGLMRALPYQEFPIQELTRALGLHTDGTRNPLFNVMFSAHDAPLPQIEVPDLEVSLYEGFNTGTTRFDLDVVLLPDDRRMVGPRPGHAGMSLVWDYDADMFDRDTVARLAEHLLELLTTYLDEPAAPLSALTFSDPVGQPAEVVSAPTIRFDSLTRHVGTALVSGELRWTYAELEQEVAALAQRLLASGVTAGQPVATVLPRGAHSVVALLACLRIGAVYAPLSPDDPAARLSVLLTRLRPALVLSTREHALSLPAGYQPVALLDVDVFPNAVPAVKLDDAAYLIHTSGSTGTPKPVVIGRVALSAYLHGISARYGLTPRDRCLVFAKPSFDMGLEDVLTPLMAGSTLVLPRREIPTGEKLVAMLAARGVTVVNLPTSYFLNVEHHLRTAVRDRRWTPRLVVLGGERLPARALRDWVGEDLTLYNAYGITEATITSALHRIGEADTRGAGDLPLGTALAGIGLHVLDAGLRPLPAGAIGELAISGPVLADGYLGDATATAKKFVTVPALGGIRVCLTGDLAYQDAEGRSWFLGRRDNQLKFRGYRIEPEEIEAAISAELGGRSCAVIQHDTGQPGAALVAFVHTTEPLDTQLLHKGLASRLPAALIPARWVALAQLPYLSGGKPDRRALATLAARAPVEDDEDTLDRSFDGPGQSVLAEGWLAVLGHDRFSPTAHFFQVGGHSMAAAQLAAWLESRLGTRPPLRTFFQHPVFADQAGALAAVAS
jgi:amino acid adenylation domain-containing protein